MSKNLSDRELLSLIKENGDRYYNILLKKYQERFEVILYKTAQRMCVYYYNKDDFLLTFYVCFENSLLHYREQKSSFLRFFNVVAIRRITRDLYNQINSTDALENAVSLDEPISDGIVLLDLIADESENTEEICSYEQIKYTLRSTTKNLKKPKIYRDIARILLLKSEGFSIKEISNKLGIHEQRVRRLIKNKDYDKFKKDILKFK